MEETKNQEDSNFCNMHLRKVLKVLLLTILLFIALELLLQIRSHLKFGQSVFNLLTNETRYVKNEQTGLLTLRPNKTFSGKDSELITNAEGLRNYQVDPQRADNSVRLVFIGASSVMGAYAKTNNHTSSALLQQNLSLKYPQKKIEVINAGIAGYSLRQQQQMLEFVDEVYNPDGYLFYSGINDFASYCKKAYKSLDSESYQLPQLKLPSWLLTTDLLLKNTVQLRPKSSSAKEMVLAKDVDLTGFRESFEKVLRTANLNNKPILVITNTRAYRADQPLELQLTLSETARFYNSCFDVAALHQLYDLHNEQIIQLANKYNYPVLVLEKEIPGGRKNFSDATHFSYAGEQLFAEALEKKIISSYIFKELFE